jgi:hypothetical protein
MAVLVLSAAATYLVMDRVGPRYELEGSVLMFPPTATRDEDGKSVAVGNPYLELGGLNTARDILVRAMTSQSARDAIEDEVPGSDFDVTADVTSAGPIVVLRSSADSAKDAWDALSALLNRVPSTLSDLQGDLDIPANAWITSRVLTADTRPEIARKSQVRAGIVAGAGVLVLGLLLVGFVDGLLTGRRKGEEDEDRDIPAPRTLTAAPDGPQTRADVKRKPLGRRA